VSRPIARAGEIRGVVFDMDDTLYPEMQFVQGGLAAAAKAAGERFGVDYHELLQRMNVALEHDLAVYGRARTVFDEALAACNIADDPATIGWLVSVYRTHTPTLEPFADVRPALRVISGQAQIALITDGPGAVQRAKFDSLGLTKFFAEAIFTDEHGPDAGKPSTTAFELVEVLMGLPGPALAYVGDNPTKDFVGARKLGWKTLRVRRAGGLHAQIEAQPGFEADAEVASLAEVTAMLGLEQ
jgi:putative hydrolase of the HAD superfamily